MESSVALQKKNGALQICMIFRLSIKNKHYKVIQSSFNYPLLFKTTNYLHNSYPNTLKGTTIINQLRRNNLTFMFTK